MTDDRTPTVIKCPACGSEAPGFQPCCPVCGYQYSDIADNLPVVRGDTEEVSSLTIAGRPAQSSPFPRRVVVPALAGLLVALVVMVFIQLTSSESTGARNPANGKVGKLRGATPSAGLQRPAAVEMAGDAGAGREILARPAASALGPAVGLAGFGDVRFYASPGSDAPPSAKRFERSREALLDDRPETCLEPALLPADTVTELYFDSPARFSHVIFKVDCVDFDDPSVSLSGIITMEDGARRHVHLPHSRGLVHVDLAGAWSSKVSLKFDSDGAAGVGIGAIEFFSFSDKAVGDGT